MTFFTGDFGAVIHELQAICDRSKYAARLMVKMGESAPVTVGMATVCVWCEGAIGDGTGAAKAHVLDCEKAPHRAALAEKDAQIEGLKAEHLASCARLTQEVESLRSQLNARDSLVLPDPVGPMFAGCKCGAYARMLGQDAIHRDDGSIHASKVCTAAADIPGRQPSEVAANDAPAVTVEKPRRGRPPDTRCRAPDCPATDAKHWPGSGTAPFCALHGTVPVSIRLEWNKTFKAAQAKKAAKPAEETAPAA